MTYAEDIMPMLVLSCSVFLLVVSAAIAVIIIWNISIARRIRKRRREREGVIRFWREDK